MDTKPEDHLGLCVPQPDELDDLECEMGTGSDHTISHVECVSHASFDIDPRSGEVCNIDQDWDTLWWTCSCGHQTYP